MKEEISEKALQNNPAFKKGFEAWLTTQTGQTQFQEMSSDKNTQYVLEFSNNLSSDKAMGETKEAGNRQPGPTVDNNLVMILLTSSYEKSSADPMLIAITLGHEAFHAENIGSGKYTPQGVGRRNYLLDSDPSFIGFPYWKMKKYYQELEDLYYGKGN